MNTNAVSCIYSQVVLKVYPLDHLTDRLAYQNRNKHVRDMNRLINSRIKSCEEKGDFCFKPRFQPFRDYHTT